MSNRGLLLCLPKGVMQWRILGNTRRGRPSAPSSLLIASVAEPSDMTIVSLNDVEELLRAGKMVLLCDGITTGLTGRQFENKAEMEAFVAAEQMSILMESPCL